VLVLEQQSGLLERSLLARGVDGEHNIGGRQDGGKSVHYGGILSVPFNARGASRSRRAES
jgi:hypothetical protein